QSDGICLWTVQIEQRPHGLWVVHSPQRVPELLQECLLAQGFLIRDLVALILFGRGLASGGLLIESQLPLVHRGLSLIEIPLTRLFVLARLRLRQPLEERGNPNTTAASRDDRDQ